MKKLLPFSILFSFFVNHATSQSAESGTVFYKSPDSNNVYTFVEVAPEYIGGDAELAAFIKQHLEYPQMERDNKIQGKVMVRFVVEPDGSVNEAKVTTSISPGLDKAAIRLAKSFPKFSPGKQQGKAVRVYFNLPVVFKL